METHPCWHTDPKNDTRMYKRFTKLQESGKPFGIRRDISGGQIQDSASSSAFTSS